MESITSNQTNTEIKQGLSGYVAIIVASAGPGVMKKEHAEEAGYKPSGATITVKFDVVNGRVVETDQNLIYPEYL